MEEEELYKKIITKINILSEYSEHLQESNITKMQTDAYKDIEDHFENIFKALNERKQQLILSVDQVCLEIQTEKKEINDKVETIKKLLETGSSMYQFQRDIAIGVWQNESKVTNVTKDFFKVKVDLPSLLEIISSHGNVDKVVLSPKKETKLVPPPSPPNLGFKAYEVSTLAGGAKEGNRNGKGNTAQFYHPRGMVLSPVDDCFYVCDFGNNLIRKVTKSGEVSTFANCSYLSKIAFYKKDKCFFFSEHGTHSIKKISLKGEISHYAGGRERGYEDGEREKAKFNFPWDVEVNEDNGDVYVVDNNNHVIRKISRQGIVSTLTGTPGQIGYTDGTLSSSLFSCPRGICFLSQQHSLFVCDGGNNRIRKISLSDGCVSTICQIQAPYAICVLSENNLLVTSDSTHQIFKVSLHENDKAEVEVFAGSGKQSYKDGTAKESEFSNPRGLAIDYKNNICFVVDFSNHRIRAIKYNC